MSWIREELQGSDSFSPIKSSVHLSDVLQDPAGQVLIVALTPFQRTHDIRVAGIGFNLDSPAI